ncbi:LOW QUALITY PROTEIN: uncharacterized protein LOC123503850 [Portunus trituberculatus]|uniref:LOW QUALITY PROTEIN: uncharacterized protein LOC123503850 n=1 Tax=Portunus trituberculatus TaxID=210409 RepID=UPI001E1CE492|nr:LOW QUALITY PROTEIN: uncharacterized protein LOC123503850 [Portunus trituberculatus]
MGWRWMSTVAAAAVIVMSCDAVIAKKSHRELESLRVSLGDAVFSRQHGVGQNWEESSSAEEPQINYDYFVQPTPDTTRPLPIAGRRTFNPRISDIDSPLADTSIRDSDTTDKNLGARKEEILQYTKTNPSHTQASTELYQEDQVWPNEDPFSVFYDSMFPEMESVIPEEETRKNIPIISPKATQKSTSTTNDPDSTIEASADTTPTTLLGETQLPTTAPVLLSSSSMQSTPSSHIPSLLNTSFDSTRFEKLITRMSLVLEKFGLSKSFTKKIFKEEEKFLNNLIHLKPLNDKLNFISHHKLSAVTSKLSLSPLLSKFGVEEIFGKITSKLNLTDVVSKLGLPDKAFKMNLTDLVSKFDIDDVDYIVDLVEAASNLNLKDLASKMNIGHVNGARLQQVQVSLSHLLEYIMSLESVKHATKELGINETTVNGVLDRVEASARQVVDDGNGGKLLLLPLFDTVSLNVVQSLGFTVLIFFLLLSAYSYISLKPVTIARDGSERPPGSLIPRPSELNPDINPHWRTALDAAEAVDSPWEHERHHHQEQGQRETVATGRPIPVPDPAALHRLGHHASSHLRTRPQQTNPHRGPLIVPVNFRSDHHIKHFPVSTQQTGHSQPVPVRPHSALHHHVSHHPVPHHSPSTFYSTPLCPATFCPTTFCPTTFCPSTFCPTTSCTTTPRPTPSTSSPDFHGTTKAIIEPPPFNPLPNVQPYEPDHYDKHRHFASYEDDDQYEDQDKDVRGNFHNSFQWSHGPHTKPDSPRTPDWHSNPTTTPADPVKFHTHHHSSSHTHNWQPQRTSQHSPSFTTTVRPISAFTSTSTPTSPSTVHLRPTSKYAKSVTSSLSEKKEVKTRKTNITNG